MKNLKKCPPSLKGFCNLLNRAGLVDFSYSLPALIWLPYGCEFIKLVEEHLDHIFHQYGYLKYRFPLLVSARDFELINKKITSFSKSIYQPNKSVIMRPSGESAIYPMFKKWIKTEQDLPLRVYQVGEMFRPGTPRGFLRLNENNFFVEAHAAFGSRREVVEEIKRNNQLVDELMEWFGVVPLKTRRPIWTNKPVAETQYAYDVLLPSGETCLFDVNYLQMQIFSKVYGIRFRNEKGKKEYTFQTEFGFSQRFFLSAIWLNSDKDNLYMLPNYSPTQVVIVQVGLTSGELRQYVLRIRALLDKNHIRTKLDVGGRDLYKRFLKYEKMGVPVRIEVGDREMTRSEIMITRRDNKIRETCSLEKAIGKIKEIFQSISSDTLERERKRLRRSIVDCGKIIDIRGSIESGKITRQSLCFSRRCVKELEKKVGIGEVIGFGLDERDKALEGKCIVCGKSTREKSYFSRRV